MFKFVILLSVVACAFGAAIPEGLLPQLDGRIVGGNDAAISSFPWQVSVQRNGVHSCGGAVYSSNIVITAAHCLQAVTVSNLMVRAGSSYWNSDGWLVYVQNFKNHEGYNPVTMANDIALIRLSTYLTLGGTIKSISLASYSAANGNSAIVSGWGSNTYGSTSYSTQLQSVSVEIVSRLVCASSTYGYGSEIKDTMICAASSGKDTCQGDSGGPLVSYSELVGIVSWGYGCAYPQYPGVYADVAVLRPWIYANVNNI